MDMNVRHFPDLQPGQTMTVSSIGDFEYDSGPIKTAKDMQINGPGFYPDMVVGVVTNVDDSGFSMNYPQPAPRDDFNLSMVAGNPDPGEAWLKIRKVANGYIVMPDLEGQIPDPKEMYVFQDIEGVLAHLAAMKLKGD